MHSLIPPSAAEMWVNCHGWLSMNLSHSYDDDNSPDAENGTITHDLGSRMILSYARGGVGFPGELINDTDTTRYQRAKMWADDVNSVMVQYGAYNPLVACKLAIPSIHQSQFGEIDCALYVPSINRLFIWEFKDGRVIVDEFENQQMINYYAGILDNMNISEMTVNVTITVVQPKPYHKNGKIRRWEIKGTELRNYVNRAAYAAEQNYSGGNCTPGSWCKYCKAKLDCTALHGSAYLWYETVSAPAPIRLSVPEMSRELRFIKTAIERLKALEAAYEPALDEELRKGVFVPDFELDNKSGSREWCVPVGNIYALGAKYGKDLRSNEPVSPTQAQNLGIPKDEVDKMTMRKKKNTLVIRSNKEARRIFK